MTAIGESRHSSLAVIEEIPHRQIPVHFLAGIPPGSADLGIDVLQQFASAVFINKILRITAMIARNCFAERAEVNTRMLMMLSAIFLALLGLVTSYFPDKVLETHGTVPDNATLLLVQMMGAVYLGFAILNWTARGVLIGGIYARPLALGNFLHFAMVGVMLTKAAITHGVIQLATSAAVFSAFAIWFGIVLFKSPVSSPKAED